MEKQYKYKETIKYDGKKYNVYSNSKTLLRLNVNEYESTEGINIVYFEEKYINIRWQVYIAYPLRKYGWSNIKFLKIEEV